ncbi:MFS transporter [Vibrio cincinnatiensis]|uniref:MFS transporter n=1 Tax=Vibrio cincinnatiensis TaxID=675 RepID=UPI003D34919C|nr:MFS transporter [Vibrio cincinnatiensis]
MNVKVKIVLFTYLASGSAIACLTLLVFGLAHFNIMRITDSNDTLESFGMSLFFVSISSIVLNIIGGYLSDQLNKKFGTRFKFILLMQIIGTTSLVIFSFSESLITFTISWVLIKWSFSNIHSSYIALLPVNFNKLEINKINSILMSSTPLFLIIFSLLIFGVLSNVHITLKLIYLCLIQLFIGIISIISLSKQTNVIHQPRIFESNKSFGLSQTHMNKRRFRIIFLTRLFYHLACSGLMIMPFLYMNRFNLNEASVSEINAYSTLGVLLLCFFGYISGFLKNKILLSKISIISISFYFLLISYSNEYLFTFWATIIFNIFNGILIAVINGFSINSLPDEEFLARDISIINLTYPIASLIMSAIISNYKSIPTFGNHDGYFTLFFICSILSIVTLLLIFSYENIVKKYKNNYSPPS